MAASFPQVLDKNRSAAVLRSCRLVSLLMFPLAFGLGIVGPTVGRAFLNDRWASVGPMLMVLCVLSAARPIGDVLESYFYASARPTIVVALEWIGLIGIVTVIPLFRSGGIQWVCAAVAIVFVVRALSAIWCVRRLDGIPMMTLLKPFWGPLAASAVMVIAVYGVGFVVSAMTPPRQLTVELLTGAIVYVACAIMVARAACEDLLSLVTTLLVNRRTPTMNESELSTSTRVPAPDTVC
jgi:O-antigen/teichoic acid export membrane protein